MAAIIITAVAGLGAGGLGFLAAIGARRFLNYQAQPYLIPVSFSAAAIVLSLATLNSWWPSFTLSDDPVEVATVLPFMDEIKASDQALYERIETSVIRDLQDAFPAERVRANAKALVLSYVADKTMALPDRLTYELYVTTRDELAYLNAENENEVCAELALGRIVGGLDEKLSPELIDRTNANIVRVITTKADPLAPKMPAEEFAELAARAFADASQATGILPDEVELILAAKGEPAKTCRLMKAFFDAILAQPVEVAAAALRTMASGERAPGR